MSKSLSLGTFSAGATTIFTSPSKLSYAGPQALVWLMTSSEYFMSMDSNTIWSLNLALFLTCFFSVEQFPVEYAALCQRAPYGWVLASSAPLALYLYFGKSSVNRLRAVCRRSLGHCRFLLSSTFRETLCCLLQLRTFEASEAHLITSTVDRE